MLLGCGTHRDGQLLVQRGKAERRRSFDLLGKVQEVLGIAAWRGRLRLAGPPQAQVQRVALAGPGGSALPRRLDAQVQPIARPVVVVLGVDDVLGQIETDGPRRDSLVLPDVLRRGLDDLQWAVAGNSSAACGSI